MDLIVFLLTICLVLLVYIWFRRPDPQLPPFPVRPLPLVGNLFHMKSNPIPLFKKWTEQCGDIFSLNLAGTHMIVLNGYDLIKEALVKKADAFSDRPEFFVDEVTGLSGQGLVLASGESWKEHRLVSLSILKTFGMGKNIMSVKIQEEVDFFLSYLATLHGKPSNIRVMTNISVCNIISSVIIGHRFQHDDKMIQEILTQLVALGTDTQSCSVLNFIPWLKYLPGDIFKAKSMIRSIQNLLNVIKQFVAAKKRDYADIDDVNNFIDAYISESNKKTSKGLPTCMDDNHLVKVIFDLFAVGTETTSTTIYWCILYALRHPDVQDKVYREIKEVVGTTRTPDMQDMHKLPYLNAFIMETQRLANIAPLSVTHMCSKTSDLNGYTIPNGALIVPNLDSVLHSKKIWGENVMDFNPQRFLDNSGKLKVPEEFVPYGIGRRICLGESMARMELLMFLSSMIQRFEFLPADPDNPPSTETVFGIICSPPPYEVTVIERTSS